MLVTTPDTAAGVVFAQASCVGVHVIKFRVLHQQRGSRMGNIKEIKIIMRKVGMLRGPGDVIVITDDDLESYNRVREALQILTEDIHGLATTVINDEH